MAQMIKVRILSRNSPDSLNLLGIYWIESITKD